MLLSCEQIRKASVAELSKEVRKMEIIRMGLEQVELPPHRLWLPELQGEQREELTGALAAIEKHGCLNDYPKRAPLCVREGLHEAQRKFILYIELPRVRGQRRALLGFLRPILLSEALVEATTSLNLTDEECSFLTD